MLNRWERALAAVSPRWAAERLYWRAALEASRAYDAGKTGRRTDGWLAPSTSANAEIGPAAARIRARARDLVRNNPWAASAVRKLAAKTVGTGIVPRLSADSAEVERRQAAADIWAGFVENSDPEGQLDFYGQLHLAARIIFESGEVLIRKLARPAAWRLPVPLQIQVLEGDYLDASRTQALENGGAIIQGVEFDAEGRRAAYWLFDEHPGDTLVSFGRRALVSRRVPAGEVLHVFDPLRSGQARGVSIFTPVVLRMRDVDDYDDAEIVRKKMAACFAAFVRRAKGATASPLSGNAATTDAAGRRVETLRPGLIQYLGLDEEMQFATPPAAEGYAEFMTLQLHAVAAGAGVTYEMLTGDLSRVNYSSLRAGMVDFWDLVDGWQWRMLVPQACRPIWNAVGALAVATGRWNRAVPWRAIWTPPKRRWVDPVKEVQAARDEVRAGLATLRDKIAEQGEDPDLHLAEIAATNAQLDQLGIVLDSDARKGRAPAAAPPDPGAQDKEDQNGKQEAK